MSIEERKLHIALQLANNANAILVAQLAEYMAQVDQLNARLSESVTQSANTSGTRQ